MRRSTNIACSVFAVLFVRCNDSDHNLPAAMHCKDHGNGMMLLNNIFSACTAQTDQADRCNKRDKEVTLHQYSLLSSFSKCTPR